jgi:hypothetical protein
MAECLAERFRVRPTVHSGFVAKLHGRTNRDIAGSQSRVGMVGIAGHVDVTRGKPVCAGRRHICECWTGCSIDSARNQDVIMSDRHACQLLSVRHRDAKISSSRISCCLSVKHSKQEPTIAKSRSVQAMRDKLVSFSLRPKVQCCHRSNTRRHSGCRSCRVSLSFAKFVQWPLFVGTNFANGTRGRVRPLPQRDDQLHEPAQARR